MMTNAFNTFFRDLAKNNNREWFHENKKRYEADVKKPFQELVAILIEKAKKYDPEIMIAPKDAIFRIHRDIRFSKDKRPYKDHLGAVISKYGRKDMEYPGLYIHLGFGEIMFAGGCYQPSKESLHKIRQAIINDTNAFDKALKDKKFKALYGQLADGEKNKILPKEFKAYGDEHPLLFNKQFFYAKTYNDPKLITRPDLVEWIMTHMEAGQSWNNLMKSILY